MLYSISMDTETLTREEAIYLNEQDMLDEESAIILAENERAELWLDEGYCEGCAYGDNLFIGCFECDIHSGKRHCVAGDCWGGPCLTEYEVS